MNTISTKSLTMIIQAVSAEIRRLEKELREVYTKATEGLSNMPQYDILAQIEPYEPAK